MRRKAFTLLMKAGLILGMVSIAAICGRGAPTEALLKTVEVSGGASGSELWLGIEGAYSFKTVQATDDTLFIDVMGTKIAGVAESRQWGSGLLTGYHLLHYTDETRQPVVRVQVEMKHQEHFTVQRESAGLRVFFGQAGAASSTSTAATPVPPPALATAPVADLTNTQPTTASNGRTVVSEISIKSGPEGQAVVDILTSRPTAYHVLHLQNPARVVVDLEEAHFSGHQRNYAAPSLFLKGVRVGQFRPDVVRVVADVTGNPASSVHAQPAGVRIELKSRSLAKHPASHDGTRPVALSTAKAELKPDQQVPQVRPAALTSSGGKGNREEASAAPSNSPASNASIAQAAPPADYQTALPASAGSREVAAAPRPEPPAETPESLRAARAAKILQGNLLAASWAPQGQTPAGAPATPAPAAQEKPQYTGEPISLNLKDVDLKDFFRLIHEISGLNIIVDPNVSGSVTLVLDSVPWDQALDIVLKNNRLDKTLEGNVLRIARVETLAAEQEEVKKLEEARQGAQPLVTVFRPVNYAKATAIAAMLKTWLGGGALTKRGTVLVDDRSNTLIISDIQSQIPVLEAIISKLDKKAKQISIEARIILASAVFTRSLQGALSGGTINRSTTTITGGAVGNSTAGAATSVTPNIPPPHGIVIQPTLATGFGAYAVSNASARYFLNAAIAAAESKNQAKTLSRPSIVTQNNVEGKVQQGAQIPIQTTINNTVSVTYIPATLQLSVTPQVTEDGNIFMIINVNNASVGTLFAGGNPAINTQQAMTQVLVPDGGTVVFGGVTVSTRSKSATYVPLIGNIPIIGHLFKTSNVADNDTELLFFVSPKVLPG
jgi:type IV pilus assembly protein PilQ